ncbi:MAG: ATP-binding protein, partial [Bacteroidota bacterium]
IKDNGIGIDPQYKERVFMIFRKLHASNRYPGTGIGLAVCRKVVEQHNGDIWFESPKGKGTTFYFTISKFLRDNNTLSILNNSMDKGIAL